MVIGLTGGIGSGKSTIAQQLRQNGYYVYDTDHAAKRIITDNQQVRKEIETLFGAEVYQDGIYQTSIVAERVFADRTLLERLNAIVHPAVREDISSRLLKEKVKNDLFFIECAILYQAGINQLCDKVIGISAPESVRLERTIARDKSDIEKVLARMRAQDTEADQQRANIVITNDGTISIPSICQLILETI